MTSPDRFSQTLDALSDPYRRQLLLALLEHNPQDDHDQDPLDIAARSEEDSELLQTELVHVHLPKLDEMGFIDWDREHNEINVGHRWEEIAPLLRLIDSNRDELPEDWF